MDRETSFRFRRSDHFVPILEGEAELKRRPLSYQEADDAHVVLLDRSGEIVAQPHDWFSDTGYRQFEGEIVALLHQK